MFSDFDTTLNKNIAQAFEMLEEIQKLTHELDEEKRISQTQQLIGEIRWLLNEIQLEKAAENPELD